MTSPSIGVLIVEDDGIASTVYEQLVTRKEEFTIVGKAKTVAEAKQLLNVITPDLVLLDVQLPDGNGIDLLKELKTTYQQMDIIMITASNDATAIQRAMESGAFTYMLKPIVLEHFYQTLDAYRSNRYILKEHSDTALSTVSRKEELPKGIDRHTLKKVTDIMKQTVKSLNADEVGKEIGASHSTSRRYLEYLVSIHQVDVEIAYGTVGRPERRYKQAAT